MLRAKNYTNMTIMHGKKAYQCDYCQHKFNLFNDLKQHIRKNHLELEGGGAVKGIFFTHSIRSLKMQEKDNKQ